MTCSDWAFHYVQVVFNHDDLITTAIKEWDNTISAPYQKDAVSLWHKLDTVQDSIALLCKDCKNTKDWLSYTKDDLTDLQNIKEDSKHHLNLTIEELQAQIKILKLEAQKHCLSLPCKALHYDI